MHGHWMGRLSGPTPRTIVLEIDDCEHFYRGNIQIHGRFQLGTKCYDSLLGYIETNNKSPNGTLTDLLLHPTSNSDDKVILPFKNMEGIPHKLSYNAYNDKLEITCTVRDSTNSEFFNINLLKQSGTESDYEGTEKSWNEFKSFVINLPRKQFIWRGQQENWPLRSAFHRTNRADLVTYLNNDLYTLRKHISALKEYKYDFMNIDDLASFMSLIQHHGYPTPLLDWTYSPYIAVYFAFATKPKGKARIFLFDQEKWRSLFQQRFQIACGEPQFVILETLALHNSRLIPQQAVSTFTNIAYLESFFRHFDQKHGTTVLQAVDIPSSESENVAWELRQMGITAGTLFPGLDGTCQDLKERLFAPNRSTVAAPASPFHHRTADRSHS